MRRERPAAEAAVARFRFNGWAKYADHRRDDARRPSARPNAARPAARRADRTKGRPVVLEGGAIDVNGRGTLLTTEECLLDPVVQVRNPGLGRADFEEVFRRLPRRDERALARRAASPATTPTGTSTTSAASSSRRTVVLVRGERTRSDANYAPLAENRERLQDARLEDGSRLEVVPLPMPAPLVFDGQRLPASYANFYVANAAVLVPTFNDPNDRVALGILAELFPDRQVVGIHAVDLVWGLGTLHCLTQQQPALETPPTPSA